MITRREWLQYLALLPMLHPIRGMAGQLVPATTTAKANYLLLVELNGGNDSLNMCIPTDQADYYRLRPSLAIEKSQQIPLSPQLALNGVMSALEDVWAAGELAILPGLGYAEPNRSHFRSIEIWDTASDSDQYLDEGWLSSVLANLPSNAQSTAFAAQAIVLGRNAAPVLGHGIKTLVMKDQQSFIQESAQLQALSAATKNPALRHLLNVNLQARSGGELLKMGFEPAVKKAPEGKGKQANDVQFRQDLKEAAAIIKQGYGAPVIKVALSGFDTHANQKATQQKLLNSLAEGLAEFRKEMQEANLWEQIAIVTYSEFGRRVAENASQGTDHGTAATHLVMGGRVKGGIKTAIPALNHLERGDLIMTTDYRHLYATVANHWLQAPLTEPLKGYSALDLFERVS